MMPAPPVHMYYVIARRVKHVTPAIYKILCSKIIVIAEPFWDLPVIQHSQSCLIALVGCNLMWAGLAMLLTRQIANSSHGSSFYLPGLRKSIH